MVDDGALTRVTGAVRPSGGSLVSLIVPIYQVEDYLAECLASIEAQTVFARTEVVLLDDGSTDGSGRIATEFADAHPNVALYRQANRGLGAARNAALERATAPLVTFLDSDDVLPPRSLEQRIAAMDDESVDLVVGGLRTFPDVREWKWSRFFNEGETVVLDSLAEHGDLIYNASVANKLFRRSQVDRLGLRCAEGIHFEDAWFTVPAMLDARRIALVGDTTYLYRRHGASIIASIHDRPENYEDHLTVVEKLLADVDPADPESVALVQRFAAHAMSGFLMRAPEVLDAGAFASFFARSRAALADIPDEVLRGAFRYPAGRIPFVALRENRPGLLDVDAALASPQLVRDGVAHLDVGGPANAALTALRPPVARLTAYGADTDKELSVFAVHAEVAVRTDIPADLAFGGDLRMRFGPDLTVPLVQTDTQEPRTRFLRAAVPVADLEPGRYPLRVELSTATGAFDVPVRPMGEHDLMEQSDSGTGRDAVRFGVDAKNRVYVQVGVPTPLRRAAARFKRLLAP